MIIVTYTCITYALPGESHQPQARWDLWHHRATSSRLQKDRAVWETTQCSAQLVQRHTFLSSQLSFTIHTEVLISSTN